jgi:beta-lactamase class A
MKKSSGLKERIVSIASSVQGTFALAWKDLRTGETVYVNEHEHFHAASTMKTPVMVEVFRQAHRGLFSLEDSIDVVNTFRSIIDSSQYSMELSADSDDQLYHRIGKKETVRSLVIKMITVSSNLATNILIDKVGPHNVMTTMHEMGLHEIQVLRGVEDGKAFRAGKNNTTTAFDLAILFESIATGTCISPAASDEMIGILRMQKFKNMIPALLPKNVVVAHKTGSITNVQHDTGIVYKPDGSAYVLVILSKNLRTNGEGIDVISRISKIIYDYVTE